MINNFIKKHNNSIIVLIIFSAFMLFTYLGAKNLWTQEWRWANISLNMVNSDDYFHPFLLKNAYYDKPLLSYWLIIFISKIFHNFNEFIMRIPSCLSGIGVIYFTFSLGKKLINKKVGLLAGWILITTFYFIFWARVANTDMLNLFFIMFGINIYFRYKTNINLLAYLFFFIAIFFGALFKGLIEIVVIFLAILPDSLRHKNYLKHFNLKCLIAFLIGLIFYLIPFLISTYFNSCHYIESGLHQVYRENILRYFAAFDHKDPIYSYFLYVPVYLMPWSFFFIPAILNVRSEWRSMNNESKYLFYVVIIIFTFLTLSSSRRNYYTLPIVPFCALYTADWIYRKNLLILSKIFIYIFYILLFLYFNIFVTLCYSAGGLKPFSGVVRAKLLTTAPLSKWHLEIINTDSKVWFYMNLNNYSILDIDSANVSKAICYFANHNNYSVVVMNKADFNNRILSCVKNKNIEILTESKTIGARLFKLNYEPHIAVIYK